MPPFNVNTIHEEILYEYAKLVSRAAYGGLQSGFITNRFKKLRDAEITIPLVEYGCRVYTLYNPIGC